MTLAAWVLSLLTVLAPPARMAALPSYPGWHETAEQWTQREQAIAADVAAVAGSREEAALLVAVAWHESALAADVDRGPCYQGRAHQRCDGGRAVSIWQLQGADADRAIWQASRRAAALEARRRLRLSARACVPRYGALGALRAYASGTCRAGKEASASMVRLARRLLGLQHG
jgi:hypothetical protein